MVLSRHRDCFAFRWAAALLLTTAVLAPASQVAAESPANPAEEPPEPPVARNDEYYPISYRSFATDITDDREEHKENGYRQGTMTWSEWWYSYERVDYTYLVGIGLMTITPISPSVTNWSHLEDFDVDLLHEGKDCKYQASKPDENSAGIQLSAGLTITADGPEVGGGAAWGVLAAGVTITGVEKDDQHVTWSADISDGSATAAGGVNDLLFFAEWRCPKGSDFTNTRVSGFGMFEFDDWGSGDTLFIFTNNGAVDTTGSAQPLDGSSSDHWRYDPEKGEWKRMPKPRSIRQSAAAPTEDQKSQLSREERLARLDAIKGLRTDQADRSGTEVMPALRSASSDPSRQVRNDVADRVSEAEYRHDHEEQDEPSHASQPSASAPPAEQLASVDTPEMPGSSQQEQTTPGRETPIRQRMAGKYRLVDRSGSVREITITESEGRVTLAGMGQPMRLERNGDSYVGEGSEPSGQGGQHVELRPNGEQLELITSDSEGNSFVAELAELEPEE